MIQLKRPIVPGMKVQCETNKEKELLWQWFLENGYVRDNDERDSLESLLKHSEFNIYTVDIDLDGDKFWTYVSYRVQNNVVPFSELVMSENEALYKEENQPNRTGKCMRCEDIKQFIGDGNYCVNLTMAQLVERIESDLKCFNLILDSDFQRGHVWTEEQQIAFIEYFLKGGKSGRDLYFNNPAWGGNQIRNASYKEYVCVDGLQRITAVRRFMNNEIPAFGVYRKNFENDWIFTHDYNHVFNFHVNCLRAEEDVLQWYIDMNIGGTPHSKEEIEKVKEMLIRLKQEKQKD